MDKFPSCLNSHIEPWMSFGSTFLDLDTNYTFLSIVGLLLVYLWYLILTPFLPSPWKSKDVRKQQDRTKEGRKKTIKGQRTSQRKAEGRKLWSIMQCPLGKPYDLTLFRQLLCPDPLCFICNSETAEVSRLLSKVSLDNGATASVSQLASTAVVTKTSCALSSPLSESPPGHPIPVPLSKCSPPSPSTVSPNQADPLEDLFSMTQLGNSLPPELVTPLNSKFSVDNIPLQLLASLSPLPQHAIKKAESFLQPEATLSGVGRPCKLSTNTSTTKSTDNARHAKSESALRQSAVNCPSLLKLAPSVLQELPDHFSHETRAFPVQPGIPLLPSPDDLTLLEGQDRRRADVLALKKEEKTTESFSKALTTCGKSMESDAETQDSAVSCPVGRMKVKPEELHVNQQSSDPKTSEDQREQKYTWLFQGSSSLDSVSLKPAVPVSGFSTSVCFNTILDAPVITDPTPLSSSENQPQTLFQTGSQFESQLVPPTKAQVQPQPSIPVLPSSTLCSLQICGVCFNKPQGEEEPLTPSQIQSLEYNILRKKQERLWGLPSVVKQSQREFCPPAPKLLLVRQSHKAHDPRYILPGDYPLTSELQKKLEHHLRKRLIQHRWGLPHRIQESLSLMKPQAETPEPSESKSSYGLTWISFFKRQSCKDLHNCELNPRRSLQEKRSETLHVKEKVLKEQGHSSETSHKHHLQNDLDVGLGNGPQYDCQTELETQTGSLLGKSSKNSGETHQKQLENALQVHLSIKFKQINEGQIPAMVHRSWHSTNATLPQTTKSLSQMKDLPRMIGMGCEGNMAQDVVPLLSSKGDILEDHIRQFHGRIMSGLPTKVQESIKNYNLGGDPSQVDDKPGLSKTLTEKSNIHGGDKMEMANSTKVERPINIALKGISAPQEPKTYDYKSQAANELNFKPNDRLHLQANDMSLASDEFMYTPLTTCDQRPSNGDTTASPELPVHFSTLGINMGQGQEPWIPAHVFGNCLKKNFPLAEKRKCPTAQETGEHGGGDAVLGPSQPRGKSHPTQDRSLEGTCGSKSSTALSMKGQPPPPKHFRNQVKHFLQWLCPGRKCKGSLEKNSCSSLSLQGSELHKVPAVFPENTLAHIATRHTDKILKEEPGCRHGALDITCPQVPLFFPMRSRKTQYKAELQVQAKSGHSQASSSKVPNVQSTSQDAAFAGQKRWIGHKNRQPQKDVPLQEKPFQRHPPSMLHKELKPQQNPTHSCQPGQVPPGCPPFTKSTVLGDGSQLPKQKTMPHHLQEKHFLSPK